MLIGLAIFTVAVIVGAVATLPLVLVLARVVQGIGAALSGPAVLAVIAQLYEGPARSRALGWFSVINGIGLSGGMIAGGAVMQWLDWRWIFILDIPAGVALFVVTRLVVPPLAATKGGRLDLLGAALATLAAVSLVYGFVELAGKGGLDVVAAVSFAVGLVAVAWLFLHLRTAANPLVPIALFADRVQVGAFISNGLLASAVTGMIFFLSQFFGVTLHMAPLATGLAFLFLTVPQLPSAIGVSRLAARFGIRRVAYASISLMIVGLLLLVPLTSYGALNVPVALGMMLIGLGTGGVFFAINSTVMSQTTPAMAGSASGMLQTSLQLGVSIGIAVLVLINALAGVTVALLTAAGFAVVAMGLMSLRRTEPAVCHSST
jgi:MFS family permease